MKHLMDQMTIGKCDPSKGTPFMLSLVFLFLFLGYRMHLLS